MLAVALVADQPALTRRLRSVLEREGLECALEADSIDGLPLEGAVGSVDAIVLCACGASRMEVFGTFARARTMFPGSPIVGIWPAGQRREDQRALRTGIDGLVLEEQIETGLRSAVRAVCAGLACLPQECSDRATETLSNREKQVLEMMVMGFTNAEIGRRLYLAESTVKSHLSSAYVKLGVRSRKDAAALVLDPGGRPGIGMPSIALG